MDWAHSLSFLSLSFSLSLSHNPGSGPPVWQDQDGIYILMIIFVLSLPLLCLLLSWARHTYHITPHTLYWTSLCKWEIYGNVLWVVSQHLLEVCYKNLQACRPTTFESKQWAGCQSYGDCTMKHRSSWHMSSGFVQPGKNLYWTSFPLTSGLWQQQHRPRLPSLARGQGSSWVPVSFAESLVSVACHVSRIHPMNWSSV